MLQELYEYALSHGMQNVPGFAMKKVRAYILVGCNGEYLGVDKGPDEEQLCPDIGSLSLGPTKCNFPAEKRSIVITLSPEEKSKYYLQCLEHATEQNEQLKALCNFFKNIPENMNLVENDLDVQKVKPDDRISFKVDGIPAEKIVAKWWRKETLKQKTANETTTKRNAYQGLCLITGQRTVPLSRLPKTGGLSSVGGMPPGDALFCFDKSAFCSYGLKAAGNACVSKEPMELVNLALTALIKDAPILAGAKWVHWYKEKIPDEEDPLFNIFHYQPSKEDENDSNDTEEAPDILSENVFNERATRKINSVKTGEDVTLPENNIYYILTLNGASGRVMIRSWQTGRYEDLQTSLDAWHNDTALYKTFEGISPAPSLRKIFFRLLKLSSNTKNQKEREAKELATLAPRLILSIINNTPIPDETATKILNYQRSKILVSKGENLDFIGCQVLKAWLNRKYRMNGDDYQMKPVCDPNHPSTAYHCGRMMAVYAAIQRAALGNNIGAGVLQRYYASASATPKMVFGRLSQLSQHHLSKMSRGLAVYYENMLIEIAQCIGVTMPTVLDPQQQAEFALGYYQQQAAFYAKKNNQTDENNMMEDNENDY